MKERKKAGKGTELGLISYVTTKRCIISHGS